MHESTPAAALYNVRNYGALGIARPKETLTLEYSQTVWHHFPEGTAATVYDAEPGMEYDSAGIQRAIDAAVEAGGGTVIVPAGDYLIAPIQLGNRICLHLEPGARLWGSPHLEDYEHPDGEPHPIYAAANRVLHQPETMQPRMRPLVSTRDAEDVSITGFGQIDSQSGRWFIPWLNTRPTDTKALVRPAYPIIFHRCRRVKLEGVRLLNATSWSLVFNGCDQVQIRGIELKNLDVINGDGIDLVNTSNVTIADCQIHTADDGIVLKTHAPDQAVRNVTITNCLIRTLCNGVKIGTETLGTFENIVCSNLVIRNAEEDAKAAGRGAWSGINLNTMDGGSVRNVVISNVLMQGVECAFFLRIGYRPGLQEPYRQPRVGSIERVSLSHIVADGVRYTAFAAGQPGNPIRHLHLSDFTIRKTRDFYERRPASPSEERPATYPHPFLFGSRKEGDRLPAWGLYLRHVEHATLRGFDLECAGIDQREPLVQEQTRHVSISGLTASVEPCSPADPCQAGGSRL